MRCDFRGGLSWAFRSPFVESKSSLLAGSYLLDAWWADKVTEVVRSDFRDGRSWSSRSPFAGIEVEPPCQLISPRRMGGRQGYGGGRRIFGTEVPGHLVLLSPSRSRASLAGFISPRRMGGRQGYGGGRIIFGTEVPGHLVLLSPGSNWSLLAGSYLLRRVLGEKVTGPSWLGIVVPVRLPHAEAGEREQREAHPSNITDLRASA